MDLASLKRLCVAATDEARSLTRQRRDLIDKAGEQVSLALANRRLKLVDDAAHYLPTTIRGQEVFCRGFDPHAVRQEISVKVSPYRADGTIGEKKFDVAVTAIESIIR